MRSRGYHPDPETDMRWFGSDRVPPALAEPTLGRAGVVSRVATTRSRADLFALHGCPNWLLTVREAADQLRVGAWAIYRHCQIGELPHIRSVDSIRIRPSRDVRSRAKGGGTESATRILATSESIGLSLASPGAICS